MLCPIYCNVSDGNSNGKVPSLSAVHMDTKF